MFVRVPAPGCGLLQSCSGPYLFGGPRCGTRHGPATPGGGGTCGAAWGKWQNENVRTCMDEKVEVASNQKKRT